MASVSDDVFDSRKANVVLLRKQMCLFIYVFIELHAVTVFWMFLKQLLIQAYVHLTSVPKNAR